MKLFLTYVFYGLWLAGISFASYKKSKQFVGPHRTMYNECNQMLDRISDRCRVARLESIKTRELLNDVRKRAGLEPINWSTDI